MRLEAQKILASETSSLGTADRIRRWRVIAPAAVLLYCLIVRAGVLDGWPGFYYAFQRALAELVLSLYLLESDLANANPAERSFASADPDCTDARKTEPAPGVPQIELASPKSEVRNS